MVTYWLEGKKTCAASRDVGPDARATKGVAVETELPGFVTEVLLMDRA